MAPYDVALATAPGLSPWVDVADVNGDADTTGVSQGLWQRSSDLGYDISPGETIYYYWWIRDTAGSPCSTENNSSNGFAVTWIP